MEPDALEVANRTLLITELTDKTDFWIVNAKRWSAVHWVVGTLCIALSALTTALNTAAVNKPGLIPTWLLLSISVAATIAIGFMGFANPQQRSRRNMQAYIILDPALRDYRVGLLSAPGLTQAHRQAEAALHGTEFTSLPFCVPMPKQGNPLA